MEQEEKLKFEVRMMQKGGTVRQAVFIGDEELDWSFDVLDLLEAKKMGPEYFHAAAKDIEKHFSESVSDFIGRKVTVEEVKEATRTGWI